MDRVIGGETTGVVDPEAFEERAADLRGNAEHRPASVVDENATVEVGRSGADTHAGGREVSRGACPTHVQHAMRVTADGQSVRNGVRLRVARPVARRVARPVVILDLKLVAKLVGILKHVAKPVAKLVVRLVAKLVVGHVARVVARFVTKLVTRPVTGYDRFCHRRRNTCHSGFRY